MVEGLEGGRAAVVVKLHRMLTDGVGGIAMLLYLLDATRDRGDLDPMPPLPHDDDVHSRRALLFDALAARRKQASGFARCGQAGAAGRLALRGAPELVRHPASAVRSAARNVRALGRVMKPPTETLSPIMLDRRGWSRFGTST